ncbi:unnamed protein product [Fraxinus pennsylvanica]|uniref:Phospholipid/glycerol acyltransferase domain-containing protein n=1 Tax=Fraxinus pennsylvanica TaxID=56036 RepID=A0AAD2A892_9LAMI|nr:unnamed protein product [Fraxinus pennsylvanica]
MVMVCFFGLKKESFRAGTAVLPKFFLQNVGKESFEVLNRGKKKVAISNLPQVMVESFLRDYLDIEFVFGRELRVFGGFFLGLMEEKREFVLEKNASNLIGVSSFRKPFHSQGSSYCKDVYLVSEGDRRNWNQLPRNLYPKPLIFHDGRLAFRPSFLATLSMFMWLPTGCILSIIRSFIALSLPYNMAIPILAFSGIQLRLKNVPERRLGSASEQEYNKTQGGLLYVCNHRTLLDPLMISYGLKTPLTAVTYSLSRMSELLAPIKTVRLARDRDQDAMLMKKMLSQGDLVVCPEGTTCREPYLLRFSPLFSQLSSDLDHYMLPVAMDSHVSMFYGTTAGGYKCLDPLFFLMNPRPTYTLQFLHKVHGVAANFDHAEKSKFDVANSIQNEIAKQKIVPPILYSFSDQDSRVRYYACEALYNIAKVVRGNFTVLFNQIFEVLYKLSIDSDPNVQSATYLLDRLVKVNRSVTAENPIFIISSTPVSNHMQAETNTMQSSQANDFGVLEQYLGFQIGDAANSSIFIKH